MLNKVILTGRLTKDPELRSTQSGASVCLFAIAVERPYRSQNGERQTDFINCVAWHKTGDFVKKNFGKGRMIAVVGSIQSRNYQDRNGDNKVSVEVVVEEASFCGEKTEPQPQFRPGVVTDIDSEDDLPFD